MAFSILIVIFSVVGFAVTGVISNHVRIDDLKVDVTPNDYFGKIDTEIKPEGNDSKISVTVEIKKTVDQKLKAIANWNFNNTRILKDDVIDFCDEITEYGLFERIVKKIEPAGKFPKNCSIPAGEWKITDYVVNLRDFHLVAANLAGSFNGTLDVGLPDAEPFIKVRVNGKVSPSGNSSALGILLDSSEESSSESQ